MLVTGFAARAIPRDPRHAQESRHFGWRDRFFAARPPSTTQSWEHGAREGPYGSGLGRPQCRFDGPEQGIFVDPVKA
jgi:hypothetical protein